MYGTELGEKIIFNDGGQKSKKFDFSENQDKFKNNFLMLWLHAYKYSVPLKNAEKGGVFEDLVIKTERPEWAK